MLSIEELEKIALQPDTVLVSLEQKLNLDYLVDRIWEELGLIRIYTKKQGCMRYPQSNIHITLMTSFCFS